MPRPDTAERELEIRLDPAPGAAHIARALIADRFAGRMSPDRLGDAQLAASELVTNAYCHGVGTIVLSARLGDGALRIEVVDQGTGEVPKIRARAEGDAPGGWGLHIVEAVSTRWGAFEGTTHVWAELPVD